MTPAYDELIAVLRTEGEALLAAGRLGLDAPVRTCGDWDVARLLRHVGRVYRWAAEAVASRATEPVRAAEVPGGVDPVAWCADALDDVVHVLRETPADAAVWTWARPRGSASWWARRLAHESSVHAWDAMTAHREQRMIPADIAIDGVDELFDVMLPRALGRGARGDGRYALLATDADPEVGDGRWLLTLDGSDVEVVRGDPPTGAADVRVSAKAGQLLLVLYGRRGYPDLDVSGDAGLLDRWQKEIAL
jgi:uncharacterized protein (TIGR03083 family)